MELDWLKNAMKWQISCFKPVTPEKRRMKMPETDDLTRKLISLINNCSRENCSNTPDFILAQYLYNVLRAFEQATQQRDTWYGRDARPTKTKDGE